MKFSTKIQASLVTLTLGAMVACGGGHSGGGGGPAPHNDPKPVDGKTPADSPAAGDPNILALDMEALTATNNSLQSESGKEPRWTLRVTINGEEKAKLDGAAFNDVSDAVKGLTFKRGDVARFEMTIADKDNAKLILATNLDTVAAADASLKSTWDGQCTGVVNPEVKIVDGGLWTFDGQGGGKGTIKLSICDFAGVTLKPILVIKAQAQVLEKKTVIYHCQVNAPGHSTNDLWSYTNTPCAYGYQTEAGETAPVISILKDYAPDAPLYNTHALVMSHFELAIGPSGQHLLTTNFGAPPFGSLEACSTQKVDVKYGSPDGIKTARLTFKRSTDQNGATVWVPVNPVGWPTLAQLVAYYSNASAEKIHLYRICEWIPEVEDTAAGNVIQFTAQ